MSFLYILANKCALPVAEQLSRASNTMLLEPAWPSVVADHQPEDWPGSVAPTSYHQDLIYLRSEEVLSKGSAQAIHGLYSFMLVCFLRNTLHATSQLAYYLT